MLSWLKRITVINRIGPQIMHNGIQSRLVAKNRKNTMHPSPKSTMHHKNWKAYSTRKISW